MSKRPNVFGPCHYCKGAGQDGAFMPMLGRMINKLPECPVCLGKREMDRPATDSEMIDLIWETMNAKPESPYVDLKAMFHQPAISNIIESQSEWRHSPEVPPVGVALDVRFLGDEGIPLRAIRIWNGRFWTHDDGDPVVSKMEDVRWKLP